MTDFNETISRLTESISQYSAATLINTTVPEYDGQQDVDEFLKRFKKATVTLTESLKCSALDRALSGAAKIWAKTIKEDLEKGRWTEVKRKFKERFKLHDQSMKHLEKIQNSKFKPEEMSLSSYVEIYANSYKKAHPGLQDKAIIQALRFNLPADIIKHLNTLSDEWVNFDSFDKFVNLILRLERKILPYEQKEKANENSGTLAIMTAIKALQDQNKQIQEALKKDKVEEEPQKSVEVVAAIAQPAQRRLEYRPTNPPRYSYINQSRNKRPFQPNDYHRRDADVPNKKQNYDGNQNRYQNDSHLSKQELQERYEQRFGKPPGPCYTCGDQHFNKHCPMRRYLN